MNGEIYPITGFNPPLQLDTGEQVKKFKIDCFFYSTWQKTICISFYKNLSWEDFSEPESEHDSQVILIFSAFLILLVVIKGIPLRNFSVIYGNCNLLVIIYITLILIANDTEFNRVLLVSFSRILLTVKMQILTNKNSCINFFLGYIYRQSFAGA